MLLEAADRRLLLALTVSVLVHAALLTPLLRVPPLRLVTAMAPIEAVIKVPEPAVQSASAVPVPAAASVPTRVAQKVRGARLAAPQRLPDRPRLAARAASPEPRAAARPASEPAGSATATPVIAAAPMAAGPAGVSADELRQYRVALAISARRFKRYPPLARERGWEGRVEVALNVSAWQHRPQLSLLRSSGHALLDEQAVSMIEQAAAATALPDSLQGRDFRVLLPIDFSLEDAR
jgi:protein TonB